MWLETVLSQWSSGNMPGGGTRGFRISWQSQRYAALPHLLHTWLSLPPSVALLNEYRPALWLSNNTNGSYWWMCCGTLKAQVCSLAYKLASTCCRPTFIQVTWVNSHDGFAIGNGDVNIILLLLLLLLLLWWVKLIAYVCLCLVIIGSSTVRWLHYYMVAS